MALISSAVKLRCRPRIDIDVRHGLVSRRAMLTDAQRDQLRPMVRTMQIIVGALCLGVLSFLIVVLILGSARPPGQASAPFLTYVAAGMAVGAVIVSLVLPSIMQRSLATTLIPIAEDPHKDTPVAATDNFKSIVQLYQTQLIVRCAILEASAFFCLVSYLIEQHALGLVGAVVLLLVICKQFPTQLGAEAWIDARLVEMEQLQQLG